MRKSIIAICAFVLVIIVSCVVLWRQTVGLQDRWRLVPKGASGFAYTYVDYSLFTNGTMVKAVQTYNSANGKTIERDAFGTYDLRDSTIVFTLAGKDHTAEATLYDYQLINGRTLELYDSNTHRILFSLVRTPR